MAHPALAAGTSLVQSVRRALLHISEAPPFCPICFQAASEQIIEQFQSCALHECPHCGLQFWDPRNLPDPVAYSALSGARCARLHPLEAGHRFFLADRLAPRCGRLLDVGCGTGGFLIAASLAGYAVAGAEHDPDVARLASLYCPRARVFPLPLESLRSRCPNEVFDIISCFSVLERQADPSAFLAAARDCLRPRGFLALSVPNRDRWHTTQDGLGHPPNHFLRWSPDSLQAALKSSGFSVMSMDREKVTVPYAAAQIDGKLRSALNRFIARRVPSWSLDDPETESSGTKDRTSLARLSLQKRAVRLLTRMQSAVCFPLAVPAAPFATWRGQVGASLYCLARKLD